MDNRGFPLTTKHVESLTRDGDRHQPLENIPIMWSGIPVSAAGSNVFICWLHRIRMFLSKN